MKYHECKVVMKMISCIALVTRPLQSVGGEGEGLMGPELCQVGGNNEISNNLS